MLRPAMIEMLKPDQDCYSFVVAVAKRARELADEAEEKHENTRRSCRARLSGIFCMPAVLCV